MYFIKSEIVVAAPIRKNSPLSSTWFKSSTKPRNANGAISRMCFVTQRPTSVPPAIKVPAGFLTYQLASSSEDLGQNIFSVLVGLSIGCGNSLIHSGTGFSAASMAARTIGAYPVQRHRFPASARSKSFSPLV